MAASSSKTRLVADLADEYRKLNTVLTTTKSLSDGFASNIGKSFPNNSGANANPMQQMTAPPAPMMGPNGYGGYNGYNNSGSGNVGSSNSAIAAMAGTAFSAFSTAVGEKDYVTNELARRRFGFFAGSGSNNTIAGSNAFKSMNNLGTSNSSLDAAQAAMSGNSMGLMSGLQNYGTITNSVAGLSNLMPGMGLENSMGAVSALNQGSSVNKLRMIGIQVRNQNGYMRDIEDIARDLWKSINNSKTGKSAITASDLSFSLQSGNSLDMLLNQYFGTDQVLRQGIISYLYQFVSENGGGAPGGGYTSDAGKAALRASGASNATEQSKAKRFGAEYNAIDAYTAVGVKGIQSGNEVLSNLNNLAADLVGVFGTAVQTLTSINTILGGADGAIGQLAGGLLKATEGTAAKGLPLATLATTYFATMLGGADTSSGSDAGNIYAGGRGGGYTGGRGGYVPPGKDNWKKSLITPKPMKDTTTGWATALLTRLGKPVTPANLDVIKAWVQHEGGLGERNNPLNVSEGGTHQAIGTYSDSIDANGNRSAIKRFSTEDVGISATVDFLQKDKYKGIGCVAKRHRSRSYVGRYCYIALG